MRAHSALGIIAIVVVLVALVVAVVVTIYDIVTDYRERHRTSRRSLESEWRIHKIKGEAQSRMWDEVGRHSDGR